MNPQNIILTGFMATGKSTVGRLLAERTGRDFVDTDELIVERTGRNIFDIFELEGEDVFRNWERKISHELAGRENLVIATGGRLMLDPLNALLLGQDSIVICLTASSKEILERASKQNLHRPLLEMENPHLEIVRLLEQREEGYKQFTTFNTSSKNIESIVSDLLDLIVRKEQKNDVRQLVTSRFPVNFPGGKYHVSVGWNILPQLDGSTLDSGQSVVVTDSNVGPIYSQDILTGEISKIVTLPAGEKHKTLQSIREIYNQLLEAGIDRRGTIIALGGGVVGDMAGFAAATYMRGIRFIQCPTTVLSMVDASVGGKTGVDLPQGKNLVGAFKQPAAVVADLVTLDTLPISEYSGGMAEIVKHGIIASPSLLDRLSKIHWLVDANKEKRLLSNSVEANDKSSVGHVLQKLIVEAILIKRDVVESDPFEADKRRLLNLGHTFAHAIEQVSGYQVTHGQAVAIGLVAATNLSARLGHCKVEFQEYIEEILIRLGLPIRIPDYLPIQPIVSAMEKDKKKTAGKLNFVLVRDAGDVFISDQATEAEVTQTLIAIRRTNQ